MLGGRMTPGRWYDMAVLNLRAERDVQLIGDWLDDLNIVWWRFLTPAQRAERAPDLEALLRGRLDAATDPGLKSTWFGALRNVAITPTTVAWLRALWQREATIPGLPLVEADETALAYALAVRGVERGATHARCAARPHHEPGPQGALRVRPRCGLVRRRRARALVPGAGRPGRPSAVKPGSSMG